MHNKHTERRAYFRIHDEIGLCYSVIDEGADQTKDVDGEMELSLVSMLANVDHDFNDAINALWREHSTVARALGLLNRKISILAAHILQTDGDPELSYEELTASISGCGMAFASSEPLAVETRLQVAAILKPSNIRVQFTARVVCCERLSEIPATSYLLRIAIDEECADAREQLVQHVVQRQFANREAPGAAGP